MKINTQILCLFAGLLAGALRSVMGWLESGKPFDARLFFQTLVRTALLGAALGYGKQQPILTFFEVYFGDAVLNKTYKIGKKKENNNE